MESGTGSTVSTPVQLEHGGGNKNKHDIGQAPPCGHTRPSTTENYPIVKGKGHEACGACGGGGGGDDDDDDDEGGKEHKLWACGACGGWGTDEGDKKDKRGKAGKVRKDDTVYCHLCKKLFLDNRSYKVHMAAGIHHA